VTLVDPHLTTWIVPIALVVVSGLFALQKRGTGMVGKLFGPLMIVWFIILAVLGIAHIAHHPGIVRAASPLYATRFIAHAPGTAFIVLGFVFLALTGGEALYADMGHFGKKPIRVAWLLLVLPSLVLNYFGQAALVLTNPSTAKQPFFESAPGWALVPLVLLATAATIIASQAVISGAFSMTKQAVQLGLLPAIPVVHTSTHQMGQVYVPFINLSLYAAVVFLIMFFKSSDNLAAAYGIAVASTMLLTTLLMYFITRALWHWKLVTTLFVVVPLALVDAVFVSSNISKVLDGGWFPLMAGLGLFTVMTTWNRGREMVVERMRKESLPLPEFIHSLCDGARPPPRVEGTAVFPGGVAGITPFAFMQNLKHNHVLHRINIFLAGTTDNVPRVPDDERSVVEDIGHGCYSVTVRHGFMELPNVPAVLLVEKHIPDWRYDPAATSFFLTRDTVLATGESRSMAVWREKLFALLGRNAARASEYYSLPADRVVELGEQISL
jgi:KUP system potassium uptake protein